MISGLIAALLIYTQSAGVKWLAIMWKDPDPGVIFFDNCSLCLPCECTWGRGGSL